jgi:hypothetical protein
MMDSIQELIEKTYVAQLSERTAQLTALEAQTNPHFLFNTLQAISTQAIVRGQEEIYNMITSLASLLRYSGKGGNLAALETEIDHVEKYLSLQKARFGDPLAYELSAEPSLLLMMVPKLGLLSLAENSITHGFKGGVTEIRILIHAEKQGGDMVLQVWDDGCGIEKDKLNELRGSPRTQRGHHPEHWTHEPGQPPETVVRRPGAHRNPQSYLVRPVRRSSPSSSRWRCSKVYKVLLIDDENPVHLAICSLIDWPKLGLKEPQSAYNGQEGLHMMERSGPTSRLWT